MRYSKVLNGTFIERPNRFIAYVMLENGEIARCHVKNTGRCRELLQKGAGVILEDCRRPDSKRATDYDLIAVYKNGLLINMDSQAPNEAAFEWVCEGGFTCGRPVVNARREVKYNRSRFDIYYESDGCPCFLEVKGVTLEDNGIVRFPDAPTERGVKHLKELIKAREEGYGAGILLVIQMEKAKCFEPNYETDRKFSETLKEAYDSGVTVRAVTCKVRPDEMIIDKDIPISL